MSAICTTVLVLTNVSSNVLKLWLVGDELLLGGNIDAHVARVSDRWRGNPDVDLSRRRKKKKVRILLGYKLLVWVLKFPLLTIILPTDQHLIFNCVIDNRSICNILHILDICTSGVPLVHWWGDHIISTT